LAIVTSLGDVVRDSRRDHASFAGHKDWLENGCAADCRTSGQRIADPYFLFPWPGSPAGRCRLRIDDRKTMC
jgi:hypothetical protein